MSDILAFDVGTTIFKMGVFSSDLEKKCDASRGYQVNIYDKIKADIEPEKWWQALRVCCAEQKKFLSSVDVISFSVTTPSLVAMAEDGTALGRAILFLDGRSHKQAKEIRERVGEEKFLRETCNLPVSGGASICSILWIRENQPEIWDATAKFGSANTYMVKRLTGQWAADPSTQSFSGLYNTACNDLTWNKDILTMAEIPEVKLPSLMQSYHKAGEILPEVAGELGLPKYCDVLCGGNDALLGALAGGLTAPGDIHNVCGTGEATIVCIDVPVSSRNFNLRCHVIPNLWVIMFMLKTGGKALEWFYSVFCEDMTKNQFFNDYVPFVLASFFGSEDPNRLEADIPEYVPFLQGSRYAIEQLTASFSGLKLETTREKMLLSLIRGNAIYHGQFLREVASLVKLGRKVVVTGGGAKINGILQAKKRWTGDFEYQYQDQSALLGAAMLGKFYQTKKYP